MATNFQTAKHAALDEFLGLVRVLRCHLFVMWQVYFDESGHPDEPGIQVCVIAGAAGDEASWEDLIPQWSQVLEKYAVRFFHAVEFAHFHGDFVGWDEARRQAFLNELLELVTEAKISPIGSAVLMDVYRKLPGSIKQRVISPYHLSFQHCMVATARYLAENAPAEQAAVVFEDQPEFAKQALQLWQDAKEEDFWQEHGHRFQSVSFGKKSLVPLQVADLIAYETSKYVQLTEGYDARQNDMRYPLRRILDAALGHRSGIWDEQSLGELRARLEADPNLRIA